MEEAERKWFDDHFTGAADQVVEFLAGGGISLEGLRVADIGAGDGIIDLGLVQRARPMELVGFDIVPTNDLALLERARAHGVVGDALPRELNFRTSQPTHLPADDAEFDVAISWSAFEHIGEPIGVLCEIRRILKPTGVFFLQLWPFYHSERGSHLWDWFPEGFHHLVDDHAEIERVVRERSDDPNWSEYMLREFRELNRLTVDQLQLAMQVAGLEIRKFELLTNPVHVPREALRYPLSVLGIAGVKLLAVPA